MKSNQKSLSILSRNIIPPFYGRYWLWPIQSYCQRFFWKKNHSSQCFFGYCFNLAIFLCCLLSTFYRLGWLHAWGTFHDMQLWLLIRRLESKVIYTICFYLQLLLSNVDGDLLLYSNSKSCGGSWVGSKGSGKENECGEFAIKSGMQESVSFGGCILLVGQFKFYFINLWGLSENGSLIQHIITVRAPL